MADIMQKYGLPGPFLSAAKGYCGYIKNGYTIDENGICTGTLVTGTIEYLAKLFAIDNKSIYNLNTINNPYQILVMSEDNKYIFPYNIDYTIDTKPVFPLREPYNPIYSLISIIEAAKTNNISIPNFSDYTGFLTSLENLIIPGLDTNDPLFTLKKGIAISSNPSKQLIERISQKFLSDINAIFKVFEKIYGKDISDKCISFSTSDISKIPANLAQFDCRKQNSLSSFTSGNNLIYIGICCCCCCLCIIALIFFLIMSSSKKKLRRRG